MILRRSSSFKALLLLWLAGNGLRLTILAIPPVLALTGFDLTFRWAAVDITLAEIAEAWPMQVFL